MRTVPRVLIAAAGSGSGKTTVTCGLLAEMRRRGLRAAGYKVGPDYIDPGHLRHAGRCAVYNLDTWIMDMDTMTALFAYTSELADIAIVEGVMGLHDSGLNSTAQIAKLLGLPVVLVINARSMGESAAAVALGFREYDGSVDLRGVILNGIGSDSHKSLIAEALRRVNIPLLGAVRRDDALKIPERHLGLLPAEESDETYDNGVYFEKIREAVASQIDVGAIIDIAHTASPMDASPMPKFELTAKGCRLGVAKDAAFSFYYPDSLMALENRGAELVYFSPLNDVELPKNINGLLLGGGFPEMFADRLESNETMRRCIAHAAEHGLPILAECGGLMYLCKNITDFDGRVFNMAGVIPASCSMNDRLQAVGYVEAAALADTPIGPKGAVFRGHEFHFSSMLPDNPETFPYAFNFTKKRTGASYRSGYSRGNVLASYLHMNFLGSPDAAENFLRCCAEYSFAP